MFISSYQITSLDLAAVLILIPLNMMHCTCPCLHCVCSCLLFRLLPPTFGLLRWVVYNLPFSLLRYRCNEIFLNNGKSSWFITP